MRLFGNFLKKTGPASRVDDDVSTGSGVGTSTSGTSTTNTKGFHRRSSFTQRLTHSASRNIAHQLVKQSDAERSATPAVRSSTNVSSKKVAATSNNTTATGESKSLFETGTRKTATANVASSSLVISSVTTDSTKPPAVVASPLPIATASKLTTSKHVSPLRPVTKESTAVPALTPTTYDDSSSFEPTQQGSPSNQHSCHSEPDGSSDRNSSSITDNGTPVSLRWAEDIHYLLSDSDGVSLFRKYLVQRQSAHLLDFYFACAGLKKIDVNATASETSEDDEAKVGSLVRAIYRRFVRCSEPSLNVSASVRRQLAERVARRQQLDAGVFDEAQRQVHQCLSTELYQDFLKSDLLSTYLQSGAASSDKTSNSGDQPGNDPPSDFSMIATGTLERIQLESGASMAESDAAPDGAATAYNFDTQGFCEPSVVSSVLSDSTRTDPCCGGGGVGMMTAGADDAQSVASGGGFQTETSIQTVIQRHMAPSSGSQTQSQSDSCPAATATATAATATVARFHSHCPRTEAERKSSAMPKSSVGLPDQLEPLANYGRDLMPIPKLALNIVMGRDHNVAEKDPERFAALLTEKLQQVLASSAFGGTASTAKSFGGQLQQPHQHQLHQQQQPSLVPPVSTFSLKNKSHNSIRPEISTPAANISTGTSRQLYRKRLAPIAEPPAPLLAQPTNSMTASDTLSHQITGSGSASQDQLDDEIQSLSTTQMISTNTDHIIDAHCSHWDKTTSATNALSKQGMRNSTGSCANSGQPNCTSVPPSACTAGCHLSLLSSEMCRTSATTTTTTAPNADLVTSSGSLGQDTTSETVLFSQKHQVIQSSIHHSVRHHCCCCGQVGVPTGDRQQKSNSAGPAGGCINTKRGSGQLSDGSSNVDSGFGGSSCTRAVRFNSRNPVNQRVMQWMLQNEHIRAQTMGTGAAGEIDTDERSAASEKTETAEPTTTVAGTSCQQQPMLTTTALPPMRREPASAEPLSSAGLHGSAAAGKRSSGRTRGTAFSRSFKGTSETRSPPTTTSSSGGRRSGGSKRSVSRSRRVTEGEMNSPSTIGTDQLIIGYYFCNETIPYMTSFVSGKDKRITLRQFKQLLNKPGRYKYFFRAASDEFDSDVVQVQIVDDDQVLPLWEGKVFAKIEELA